MCMCVCVCEWFAYQWQMYFLCLAANRFIVFFFLFFSLSQVHKDNKFTMRMKANKEYNSWQDILAYFFGLDMFQILFFADFYLFILHLSALSKTKKLLQRLENVFSFLLFVFIFYMGFTLLKKTEVSWGVRFLVLFSYSPKGVSKILTQEKSSNPSSSSQ